MSRQLSESVRRNLDSSLETVGDMALKRCARNIVEELELLDGDKILEIGCGNGYILSLLNRLDMKLKLVGVDRDKRALSDAKKFIANKEVELIYASAENLPFRNNSFNKIVMSAVIEHVDNDKKVLEEAFRILKKDGILTLTTCNINYPFLWDPINWILQHFFHTHIKLGFWAGIWNQHERLYRKEQIEKMLKQAQFKIDVSQLLTFWCLPFNHYIVNFIAILFYNGRLPRVLSTGMNKFKNNKQSRLVKILFAVVNLIDTMNDLIPLNSGVSIFIKAKRSN